jgi:transposase
MQDLKPAPTVTSLTAAILKPAASKGAILAPTTSPKGTKARRKKTSTTPTRIYSYGAHRPTMNAQLVEDQLKNARRYYNELVSIERAKRTAIQAERLRHGQLAPLTAAVDVLVAQYVAAKDALKAKRAGAGKLANVQAERTAIQAIAAQLKMARTALTAERDRVKNDPVIQAQMQPALDQIKDKARTDRKAARKVASQTWGVRHGTYRRVEDAVIQAGKRPKKGGAPKITRNGKPKLPTPWHMLPAYKPYDGTGSFGTQLTASDDDERNPNHVMGMTVREAFSCQDTRLQIDPVPANTYQMRRHHRRRASRTRVRIRIGSNKDRSPIWAEFPVILHRPLPDDAVIKWAYIVRKRIGLNFEYRFQLTIESKTFEAPTQPVGSGVVAIDLGWRNLIPGPDWHDAMKAARAHGWRSPIEDARNGLLDPKLLDDTQRAEYARLQGRANQLVEPYGVRVGYWVDDIGNSAQIQLPERTRLGVQKPDDLHAIRAKNFDVIRRELSAWVAGLAHPLPHAIAERFIPKAVKRAAAATNSSLPIPSNLMIAARIANWGAESRMAALYQLWKQNRFTDTSTISGQTVPEPLMFAAIEAWDKQDRHLYRWEADQRDRRLNHRREQYRVFAANLARTYATIVLEDPESFKLTKAVFAEAPEPEDGLPMDGRLQRRTARLAAPGELREAIIKAAAKCGAKIVFVSPRLTTQRCHLCKFVPQSPWDAKPFIAHTCGGCAAGWDQDYNACKNMLDDYLQSVASGIDPSTRAAVLAGESSSEIDEDGVDDGDMNDEAV